MKQDFTWVFGMGLLCAGVSVLWGVILGLMMPLDRAVELFGDVFRWMIIPLIGVWIMQRRFTQLRELVCVGAGVLCVAGVLKIGLAYLGGHYESLYWIQNIAQRPINGELNGFPSGHTTLAFIAVFFVWKYGDRRWGILVGWLALLVALSRVWSGWHTPLQVCAGAGLGLGGSMLLFKTLQRFYPQNPER